MEKKTDRPKISVTEHRILVAPGQSKKLAAIRQKQQPAPQMPSPTSPAPSGLTPDVAKELNKARTLIDDRLKQILGGYPEGKKNSLFKIRFGCSVEQLKAGSIKAAFNKLELDSQTVDMKSIADLNFDGNAVNKR
ncbi:MAG: hypothetical protein ACXWF8_03240 [Methylobacter sp.]